MCRCEAARHSRQKTWLMWRATSSLDSVVTRLASTSVTPSAIALSFQLCTDQPNNTPSKQASRAYCQLSHATAVLDSL